MEQEPLDRESLCLNYEGQWELTALEQVEVILPCPDMIEVPGDVYKRQAKYAGQGRQTGRETLSDLCFAFKVPGGGYTGELKEASRWDRKGRRTAGDYGRDPYRRYTSEGTPAYGEASATYFDNHTGIHLPDADFTVGPECCENG